MKNPDINQLADQYQRDGFASPVSLLSELDIVEKLIGQDIFLYKVTFIIKKANTKTHVSWHQDLTYWGKYPHFATDLPATTDLDPVAIEKQRALEAHYESIAGRRN